MSDNGHLARRKRDRRVALTRQRLGRALIALVQERPFDEVTVKDVIDRAGVGRSTFYDHFKDKDDLFFSDVDEFLDAFANALSRSGDPSKRIAPVRELFEHVGEMRPLYRSLVVAGRLPDFLDLARAHFARGIYRRMRELEGSANSDSTDAALAHALAGSLLSLLVWWIDADAPQTPQEMDRLFHSMVWSGATSVRDASPELPIRAVAGPGRPT